jgi:hypothetical protein
MEQPEWAAKEIEVGSIMCGPSSRRRMRRRLL